MKPISLGSLSSNFCKKPSLLYTSKQQQEYLLLFLDSFQFHVCFLTEFSCVPCSDAQQTECVAFYLERRCISQRIHGDKNRFGGKECKAKARNNFDSKMGEKRAKEWRNLIKYFKVGNLGIRISLMSFWFEGFRATIQTVDIAIIVQPTRNTA